jgi:hypothetical protein
MFQAARNKPRVNIEKVRCFQVIGAGINQAAQKSRKSLGQSLDDIAQRSVFFDLYCGFFDPAQAARQTKEFYGELHQSLYPTVSCVANRTQRLILPQAGELATREPRTKRPGSSKTQPGTNDPFLQASESGYEAGSQRPIPLGALSTPVDSANLNTP